ncbi:MAG: TIGR00303 family protein [Candidatus Melainabacteria bacterium]|nr:MAG: TIGR00303 family protein [Candidatus Melainabacteria bacterium]
MSRESIVSPLKSRRQEIPHPVKVVNDPEGITTAVLLRCRPLVRQLKFILCLAGTRVSDVPDVSAAGTTPTARRLTPALDADLLLMGKLSAGSMIPRSPAGVVSPVILTRACAQLFEWPITVVDCGVFQTPQASFISLGNTVADCISTGFAQPRSTVDRLFEEGFAMGKELAGRSQFLVLAESVPGGTTTALAVLTLLGYDVAGLISTSLPNPNRAIKQELLQVGLTRLGQERSYFKSDPLAALAAMGDPMQAVVAGMALAAADSIPVILAGGSQMLAVYAIFSRLWTKSAQAERKPNLIVCTSRWIVNDSAADTRHLAQLLEAPLAFADIDFSQSRHHGLKLYEQGHVKEGCGAGAALLLSCLSGEFSENEIIKAIDATYDQMIVAPASN